MADRTGIEWTDATWNPVRGCSRVSEGCRNCYAEEIAARFSYYGQPYYGFAKKNGAGSKWTGNVYPVATLFGRPFEWKRPRRISVNSMSDMFHEKLANEAIDNVFAVMALNPRHTFQVLTKRADRLHDYMTFRMQQAGERVMIAARELIEYGDIDQLARHQIACGDVPLMHRPWVWPLPNVLIGVSAENQEMADERIPLLLDTPAAKRIVSFEPLLGPIDISAWIWGLPGGEQCAQCTMDVDCECNWRTREENCRPTIDWAIVGGESGADARPMHPKWARDLRDQCRHAGVPFFFKQWGEWFLPPREGGYGDMDATPFFQRVGKRAAGSLLDGFAWTEFPR